MKKIFFLLLLLPILSNGQGSIVAASTSSSALFPDWRLSSDWASYKRARLVLKATSTQTETFGTLLSGLASTGQESGCNTATGDVIGAPYSAIPILKILPRAPASSSTFGTPEDPAGASRCGAVLAPNNFIYTPPLKATTILKTNPANSTFTEFGTFSSSVFNFASAALGPASKDEIWCAPFSSPYVLVIHYLTDTYEALYPQSNGTFASTSDGTNIGGYVGITLGADLRLWLAPYDQGSGTHRVCVIDPIARTWKKIGSTITGHNLFSGIVQSINATDDLYLIPYNYQFIVKINPYTETTTQLSTTLGAGTAAWGGGALAVSGKIVVHGQNEPTILVIDPDTDTFVLSGSFVGASKLVGSVLTITGQILGIPHNATYVPFWGSSVEPSLIPIDCICSRFVNHY